MNQKKNRPKPLKETNYSLGELIEKKSFRRWVQGNASEQEKVYWDRWIMRNSENRALAIRAQKEITDFSIRPSSRPDQNEAWRRLQNKMNTNRKYDTSGRSRNTGLQWVYRIAAVFLLAALTGLFVNFFTDDQVDETLKDQFVRNEVVTEYGERKTINLSDGSKITLNAHSNLVYTINPADSNAVEVFLDGEAYFSIAERENPKDSAFRVKTSSGLIRVMGTQFVVSTRNRDTRVVLEEGEIALTPSNQIEETILEPGQLAEFSSDSDTIQTKLVNPKVYTSWTTYRLVFDKTPFSDVIARLENTYGVKVVIRDTGLFERKISGAVDNTSLDIITSALSNTLDTPIEVTGSAVYIGKKYPNQDFRN